MKFILVKKIVFYVMILENLQQLIFVIIDLKNNIVKNVGKKDILGLLIYVSNMENEKAVVQIVEQIRISVQIMVEIRINVDYVGKTE